MRPRRLLRRRPRLVAAPRRARRGFTVVEAMVAILVLAFGVLGLMGTSGALTKQISVSRRQMRAASLVRQRLERLGAVTNCAAIAAPGVPLTGTATAAATGVVERYTITTGFMTATLLDSVTIPPLKNPVVIQSGIRCQ